MDKLGTIIHGIGASEHLDSSGERIQIEGVDISSLTVDGLINFEHKSEAPSQLIGKIVEATKIMKKEDCKNDHHEKFWDKAGKTPYLYIKAILFDKFNHQGALDAVAMLKFDQAMGQKEDVRQIAGFSIEGSRLEKDGSLIKKCIARKMSFTAYPCNKACVTEILDEDDIPKSGKGKFFTVADLKAAFKKSQDIEIDLQKAEGKYNLNLASKLKPKESSKTSYSKITPATGENRPAKPFQPKTTYKPSEVSPKTSMVGNRISYDKPKAKTGHALYNDPKTFKAELESMSNTRKAIINKIKIKKNMTSPSTKTHIMMSEKKMKRTEILKSISQEAFDLFPHKEELLSAIRKTMPDSSEKEVEALAKTYAYMHQKKEEIKLAEMADDSSLNDE